MQPLCIPWHLIPTCILNGLDLLWFLLCLLGCVPTLAIWGCLKQQWIAVCGLPWCLSLDIHTESTSSAQQKFHVKPQCFTWLVAVLFFLCYQWLLVYHNHLRWQFLLDLVFVFPLYLLFILYAFSSSKASLVLPERQNWSRIWCYLIIKVDW